MSNFIIKNIGSDRITLAGADGAVVEIQNQLSELKTLLQNQQVQNVQYADKIYNIEHIDEANFGMLTGKKPFNEHLTKALIEHIQNDCGAARKFLERVAAIPEWEAQSNISDKAKEVIAYSFIGPIGTQLSKLMAIGKEGFSDEKQRKYLEKCLFIVKKTLDLVTFAFLSTGWDLLKNQSLPLTAAQKQLLQQRFDTAFEPSISDQFRLLQLLSDLFAAHADRLIPPFLEWSKVAPQLSDDSALHQNTKQWKALGTKLDKAQYDVLDCAEAERCLADFFGHFYFLVNYQMASIKHIGYHQSRNTDPRFLHRYLALGIDSKANVDAEKVNFIPEPVTTDAVLLYRGDYKTHTNLFPFVIDFNALQFEHGAKICFFQSKNLTDGSLEYLFLENNTLEYIEKKGLVQQGGDLNDLLLKEENQKIMKLDSVVDQFNAARACLLAEISVDFSDL